MRVAAAVGDNPLNFGVSSMSLARLMETGKVEEGDKALGPDDKKAIAALRGNGGIEGVRTKLPRACCSSYLLGLP